MRAPRLLLRAAAVIAAVVLLVTGIAYGLGSWMIRRAEPDGAGLPAGVAGRLVAVGNRPVHVVERGRGDPILLLHGLGGSTFDWEEHVVDTLAADHRVIAIDLFGMGFSARDDALAYGTALWATQVRDTMDVLGIARATLVGHSLGAAVAVTLAATDPERVERLVLVSPAVPLDDAELPRWMRVLATPGAGEIALGWMDHLPRPGESEVATARARQTFRVAGTRGAILRHLRHGRAPDALADAYRALRVPTLVVHGTADDVVPWPAVQRTAAWVDGVLVLPIDGAGHWLPRDAPDRIVAAVHALRP